MTLENTNTGAPEPVIKAEPAAPPVVEQSSGPSLLDAFKSKFEIGDDVTEDDLVSSIEKASQRAALLDENENEETLRSYREAHAWKQQAAQDWEKFQQWKASQGGGSPEIEQAKRAAEAKAEEIKRKYAPVRIDPTVMQYLERDPKTGLFKAILPELAPRAEEANRALQYRQRVAEEMYDDPYAFGEEISRPLVEQIKKEMLQQIEDLKRQLAPVQQQMQMSALEAFEAKHASYLTKEENGVRFWTPAGEAYDKLLGRGMAPQDALEIVQGLIPPSAQKPAENKPDAPAAPEVPQKSKAQQFIARAKNISRSTGQPTQADGTIVTAAREGDMQNKTRMTPKARWKAAAQQAEKEILEGQAS